MLATFYYFPKEPIILSHELKISLSFFFTCILVSLNHISNFILTEGHQNLLDYSESIFSISSQFSFLAQWIIAKAVGPTWKVTPNLVLLGPNWYCFYGWDYQNISKSPHFTFSLWGKLSVLGKNEQHSLFSLSSFYHPPPHTHSKTKAKKNGIFIYFKIISKISCWKILPLCGIFIKVGRHIIY